MKFWKIVEAAVGIAVTAAIVPYKFSLNATSDEENSPKKLSIESLTYRLDVTPTVNENGTVSRDVSLTIPADGLRRVFGFAKDKAIVARDKAVDVKNKCAEKAAEHRAKRAAKKAAAAGNEATVIEIEAEEPIDA